MKPPKWYISRVINIFSLYRVIVRPIKIMKNLVKGLKIQIFKFWKLVESLKLFLYYNIWLGDQLLSLMFWKFYLVFSGQSCTLVWMPNLKFKSWTDSSYCVDRAQQGVTKWGGILIFNDTLLLLALFHIENLLLAVVCCRYNLSINTYPTSHESLLMKPYQDCRSLIMAVGARRDIRHPKKEILDRLVNQKVLFSPSILVELGILNFWDLLLFL